MRGVFMGSVPIFNLGCVCSDWPDCLCCVGEDFKSEASWLSFGVGGNFLFGPQELGIAGV